MARIKLPQKLTFMSILLIGLSAWSIKRLPEASIGSWSFCFLGVISVSSICLSLLFMAILWMRPSPHHGVGSVLMHLFYAFRFYTRGRQQLQELKRAWKNPKAYQERLLLQIMRKNQNTEYGRKFKLADIGSIEDFRRLHPLTTYEHYQSYIDRSKDGEVNVMIPGKSGHFVITSGTTGKSKYIPHENHKRLINNLLGVPNAIIHELCPKLRLLQSTMMHYVIRKCPLTRGGGRVTCAVYLYEDGRTRYCLSTPLAGFRIDSVDAANYIHLLFSLRDPNLGVFFAVFTGVFDSVMRHLERHWEDIVVDIERGTINSRVKLDDDIRASLVEELKGGDPQRAKELRREFEQGFENILPRVWRHLAAIMAIDNVASWQTLKSKYAKDMSLICFCYGCSEGMMVGCTPWYWDERPAMALNIVTNFYEFIKLADTQESQPKTYLVDELEIGESYELVLTQASGLYRFRMGDIVRAEGRIDNSAVIQFLFRLGLMLNLHAEKMDQQTVKTCLQNVVGRWPGVTLVEYAAAESLIIPETSSAFEKDETEPYYVIFLELAFSADNENPRISLDQKNMIDVELRELNEEYDRRRREGYITQPRVHIVKPSTFDDLKEFVLAHSSASANQYKVPRKLRTAEMLEFMLRNVA